MTDRLPTHLLVAALLRRVNDAGGLGVVLAKGDPQAGAILAVAAEPDKAPRLLERALGFDGGTTLIDSTPSDAAEADDYWRRRRARDPDLWVIELNIPEAERFIAETIAGR